MLSAEFGEGISSFKIDETLQQCLAAEPTSFVTFLLDQLESITDEKKKKTIKADILRQVQSAVKLDVIHQLHETALQLPKESISEAWKHIQANITKKPVKPDEAFVKYISASLLRIPLSEQDDVQEKIMECTRVQSTNMTATTDIRSTEELAMYAYSLLIQLRFNELMEVEPEMRSPLSKSDSTTSTLEMDIDKLHMEVASAYKHEWKQRSGLISMYIMHGPSHELHKVKHAASTPNLAGNEYSGPKNDEPKRFSTPILEKPAYTRLQSRDESENEPEYTVSKDNTSTTPNIRSILEAAKRSIRKPRKEKDKSKLDNHDVNNLSRKNTFTSYMVAGNRSQSVDDSNDETHENVYLDKTSTKQRMHSTCSASKV